MGHPGGTSTDLLEKVRAQFGSAYDPARQMSPESLAQVICTVLSAPADVQITEISCVRTPS